jgi:MtaA/CmuA family methyltransferase
MTPYERLMNRLEGKPVDRIPNLNILMSFAADYIGVPYSEYAIDYKKLVQGYIKCCQDFNIDAVSCISDPVREAHDMGADINIPFNDTPHPLSPLIKEFADIKKIKIVNPVDGKRMSDRIKAVELFKKEVGGYYPIIGWVEGALAEAADLRGVSELMMDLIMSPDFCIELLEKSYAQTLLFAKAQIEAGADFIGVGDAVASLIGPELYEEFAFPYEKRICDEIHSLGAKMKLHICGNTKALLPKLKEVGADIFDVDYPVNFKYTVDIFEGSKTAVNGNVNPVAIMMQGTEEDVSYAIRSCIDVCSSNTIISAGCEIPRATPYKNLLAMSEALK